MKARLLLVLAAGLMVGAADPAPDLGEAQSQEIPPESKWFGGEESPWIWEFGANHVLLVTGVDGKPVIRYHYTLHGNTNPPRLDLLGGCGIYRLKGDRLLICLALLIDSNRPTTFTNRPKAEQYLYTLRRLK